MKRCRRCEVEFPATLEFFYASPGTRTGLQGKCITCQLADQKAHWHSLPKEERSRRGKTYNLRQKYGITPEDFDNMLARQDGRCAVCGTDQPGGIGNTLHVDHDHDTGTVRGLLCVNCNKGLGHFKDDPELLQSAINYLFILRKVKP